MNSSTPEYILVVEDDAELRFILMAHLQAAGFRTLEATNAAQAYAIASDSIPSLIIMDVGLPGGVDGIEATRTIKSDTKLAHIPIIMLTGRSRTEDVVHGLEAGAQEYLCKPFELAELLARVHTVLKLSHAREDLDRLNTQLEEQVDVKTKRLQLLYEYMRDLSSATTRNRVYDLAIKGVQRMTGANRISLFVRETSTDQLRCAASIGIDADVLEKLTIENNVGISGQVYKQGRTLAARAYGDGAKNANQYQGDMFVSTPLISALQQDNELVLGVINVTNKYGDAPFQEEEIEGIRSIADAAAIALDGLSRQEQLELSVSTLVRTVAHLAEYKDEETTEHLERVAVFAEILAQQLQKSSSYAADITDDFLRYMMQAAPMHDIGKVGIPDDILTKPGKLTDDEFRIMRTHTEIGRRVLSQALLASHESPLLQMCIDIAHCHHERWNGKGYPRGLKEKESPLAARIVALVDAYDAITSERRYSAARSHVQAMDIVRSERGQHFDPVIVDSFLECQAKFNEVRSKYTARQAETALVTG